MLNYFVKDFAKNIQNMQDTSIASQCSTNAPTEQLWHSHEAECGHMIMWYHAQFAWRHAWQLLTLRQHEDTARDGCNAVVAVQTLLQCIQWTRELQQSSAQWEFSKGKGKNIILICFWIFLLLWLLLDMEIPLLGFARQKSVWFFPEDW